MDTLVLLGAGASYGSYINLEDAPPLGNGLFVKLLSRSEEARKIPSDLQEQFIQNFEDGMSEYFRQRRGNVARLQLDIGNYLASFIPDKKNAYFELLSSCNPLETTFASLNYDTLLEECISTRGRKVEYSLQNRPHRTRVIKPHGSSNFWPSFPPGALNGCTAIDCQIDVVAPIIPLSPDASRARYPLEGSFSPCMSLYAPNKPVRTSPEFVQHQQRLWDTAVHHARQIIVMGVRVNANDTHIWQPLRQAEAPLHYFGLAVDRDEFSVWASGRSKESNFHQFGFRDAVNHLPLVRT